MTRAAAATGLVLGGASIAGGAAGWQGLPPVLFAGAGIVLLVVSAGTLRRNTPAHIVMLALALGLLAAFMPQYFRRPLLWPTLVLIALATVTLGLGLVGFLLDRFTPGPAHRSL